MKKFTIELEQRNSGVAQMLTKWEYKIIGEDGNILSKQVGFSFLEIALREAKKDILRIYYDILRERR